MVKCFSRQITYLNDDDDDDDDDDDASDHNSKDSSSCSSMMQKRFLRKRKIFLWGSINDVTAKDITEKLLYLELSDPGKPIDFFINTPGGSITSGMSIYDTMILISSPIRIIVTGIAASMGSILLCGAKKGNRFLYPNSRVLIHQPLIMGQIVAQAVDINIQAQEMEKTRAELNKILAASSGQPIEKITKDTDRDFYMNAKEAIDYGLADKIIKNIF
ncbi:MAG: ATP-dependent Clp protease proteolytic subunit [Puniceicoccales bacterium]|jgi:ATP-dependent Clp protease protease subunit|nr:ATP-dependent Clp protease proteolytic subunit [Puniceicoccales bacterium]